MAGRLWILLVVVSLLKPHECEGYRDPTINSTKTYLVGSILVEPFLMAREEGHVGGTPEYVGFIPDLLHELEERMGVKFKVILTPDKRFGDKKADGTWDGMVGTLTRREVDIAAGPLTITSRRGRVIDFSKPFMSTGTVMVISGGLPEVTSSNASAAGVSLIWKPFTAAAWFMLFATITLVLVLTAVISHRNSLQDKSSPSFISTLITTCGTGYSGCVLRGSLRVFAVLTVVLYTAGVVGLLLHTAREQAGAGTGAGAPGRQAKNMDIVDIVQSNNYKMVTVRDGASQAFLMHSTVPVYLKLYERLHYVNNVTAGFNMLLDDPGAAFITDSALVDYYLTRRPYCGLRQVGMPLNANGYGLAYPPKSPLYDLINLSIMEMRETGLLQMLYRKWWHDRAQCPQPEVDKMPPLPAAPRMDGHTVGGALIVLAVGLLLTGVVGIIEMVLSSRSDKVTTGGRRPLGETDSHPLHIGGSTSGNLVRP